MMTMIMMIIFRMVLEWSPQDGALYAWGAPLQATTFWYSKFFLFRRQNSLWRLLLPEVGATYKVWDQRWEMQWVMTFKQIPLVGSDRLTMNWYELMKLIEADVPKKVVDSHIFRSIQKPWFGVFMLGDSTSIMSARVEWTLLKWTHFFPTQLPGVLGTTFGGSQPKASVGANRYCSSWRRGTRGWGPLGNLDKHRPLIHQFLLGFFDVLVFG